MTEDVRIFIEAPGETRSDHLEFLERVSSSPGNWLWVLGGVDDKERPGLWAVGGRRSLDTGEIVNYGSI